MKKLSILFFASLALIATSCENSMNEESVDLKSLSGAYVGEFTTEGTIKNSSAAQADIALLGDAQVEVHCYGEMLDTTLVLDVYEHLNDSVMVCNTGEDFYHEYGHMQGGMHNMHHSGGSNWMHHMADEHQEGDQHYGGFNMEHHTFEYTFKMGEENSMYYLKFSGKKK